jgi:hypothetical protein
VKFLGLHFGSIHKNISLKLFPQHRPSIYLSAIHSEAHGGVWGLNSNSHKSKAGYLLSLQPLSVEQPLQASGWSTRRKTLVFGGIALIAALVAILLFTQLGGGTRTTRDLARVEEDASTTPGETPSSKTPSKGDDSDDDYDEYDKKPDPKEEKSTSPTPKDDDNEDIDETDTKGKEKASKDAVDYEQDYKDETELDDDTDKNKAEEKKQSAKEAEENDYDYGT